MEEWEYKMIFELEEFKLEKIESKDLNKILEIYNSNGEFLINHMDKSVVTEEWIIQELKYMEEMDFKSCKIVERHTENILGIIDFKIDEETYLSLLMIHKDFQGNGLGHIIYQGFEEYIESLKGKSIRIDVVTNYDSSVLKFWTHNGFVKLKDIELNWAGKTLPAVIMKKRL